MANETNETAKENTCDKADASDKKPEGSLIKRSKAAHLTIAVIVFALIITALIFWDAPDIPTGKVLEPVAPEPPTPEQIAEFNRIVAICNQYIADRDNNNTIECLRKADAVKTDLKVVSVLADLNYYTGNNSGAITYYSRAIEIDPNDARLRYNYALSLERMNLTEAALSQYAKAAGLESNYTAAINNRGILFQKLKMFNESKQEFEKALVIEPNNTIVLVNYANLLAEMSFKIEAEQEYRKALALNPNSTGIYRNFGQFLFKNGRYAEAKEMFDKSV